MHRAWMRKTSNVLRVIGIRLKAFEGKKKQLILTGEFKETFLVFLLKG